MNHIDRVPWHHLILLLLVLLLGTRTLPAQGRISVPSSATGGFGSSSGCFSGLVPVFAFQRPGTVLITGGGTISISGTLLSTGGLPPMQATSAPALPIEQSMGIRKIDTPLQRLGALIGSFVPESGVSTPGFQPIDEKLSRNGISASSLFFIGGGRYEFHAPGPGTLFLGINGPANCGDSGSFSISIEIPVRATIFPKSFADSLSTANASAINIAILGSENFDPRKIDPKSLTLAALPLKLMATSGKLHCTERDVNGDGFPDLVCEFHAPPVQVRPGSVLAVVQGNTTDGIGFRAEMPINILPGPPGLGIPGRAGVPQ